MRNWENRSTLGRNGEDAALTGSYWRPLDVIIVSAKSRMSAPTSAGRESPVKKKNPGQIFRSLSKCNMMGKREKYDTHAGTSWPP